MNHTGDATLLRKVNESAVLDLVREQGPIARAELARRLHLSSPTITRIMAGLIGNGLVREHSFADSRGGRPPTLLEYNWRASAVIGVYVGEEMLGALTDLRGGILARRTLPSQPGEAGITQLIGLIDELRREAAAEGLPVRGIGIGAPSIVLFDQGIVVWSPGLGWRDLPLRRRLEDTFSLPVFIENEVNAAALGEAWQGAGQGRRNLVCISLSTGIGAGLILHGQLYRGSHDAAGEVGYLVPGPGYLGSVYQALGCLESLAGSGSVVARAKARLAAGEDSMLAAGRDPSSLTAGMVLAAARQGDRLSLAVVDEMSAYLAVAVANLACILDPEIVVITGDLAEFGDLFAGRIRTAVQGVLPSVPNVVVSDLRTDAAVLGAVAVVLNNTSDEVVVTPSHI